MMSRFWDLTFLLELALVNFRSRCYYRFLRSHLLQNFSPVCRKNSCSTVKECQFSKAIFRFQWQKIYNIYRSESKKIRVYWNWCATFVLKRTSSLRRSRGCSARIPLLRDQLLALIGHVMFESVKWSWFGPVVDYRSSHLIMYNR